MTTGIYKIQRIKSTDCYVGQSVDIESRWKDHRKALRKNEHHSAYLQRAWNKYGETCFVFDIVEKTEFDTNKLLVAEQRWMNTLNSCYNMAKFAGSTLGTKRNPEVGKKIAAKLLGYKHSDEARRNMSIGQRNRKHPADECEKRAEKLRGLTRSVECRRKLSILATGRKSARKGAKVTQSTKEKMVLGQIKRWAEHRAQNEWLMCAFF